MTQAPSSMPPLRLASSCGRATFAIVASNACIAVAIISAIVARPTAPGAAECAFPESRSAAVLTGIFKGNRDSGTSAASSGLDQAGDGLAALLLFVRKSVAIPLIEYLPERIKLGVRNSTF